MTFLQFLGYLVIVLGVFSLVSYWLVTNRENKRWMKVLSAWKKTTFTPEEVQSDLDAFSDLYVRVHPEPFHALSEEEWHAVVADLKRQADHEMTRPEVYCLLASVVSRFNDEHTQVRMPTEELNQLLGEEGKVFPYEVTIRGEHIYLTGAKAETKPLPAGTRLLSVNGVPAAELVNTALPLFWGRRDAQRAVYAQKYFAEVLYLAYGFEDLFDVVLQMPDGEQRERRLSGVEYKVEPQEPFSYRIQGETLLLDYRKFEDPKNDFKSFMTEMLAEGEKHGVKRLVIDVRGNQGGASSLGDTLLRFLTEKTFSQFDLVEIRSSPEVKRYFMSFVPGFLHWFFPLPHLHPLLRSLWHTKTGALAEVHFQPLLSVEGTPRFNGPIYLLIDAGSMSSTSLLASTVKQYEIGTLVGEPTGGHPYQYGNMLDFHLEQTGLKVMIPSSIVHGKGTSPVEPDVLMEQRLEDLSAGKDTVLAYVQTLPAEKA